MLNIRLVVPPQTADDVLSYLRGAREVADIAHLPGASFDPPGDLVFFDVPPEASSAVLEELHARGLPSRAEVVGHHLDLVASPRADVAEREAPGSAADAVVWEEVEDRVGESAEPSVSFYALMALATMIGAVGILTDSIVLIIGAMVVGPEFGPLAGLCSGIVQRRPDLAARSLLALATGFPLAIAFAALLVVVLRATGVAPDELQPAQRSLTEFISHPSTYSVIVALLAGVTGMLAFTRSNAAPLIGVLISVTTIPAAANVGVGLAYGDANETWGAAAQLGVNLVALTVAGSLTMWTQLGAYHRRRAHR
jgi:uncharacterized hydrophobic protein (TIGR00271 family)